MLFYLDTIRQTRDIPFKVCLLIEDTEFEPAVWDGEAVKVGRFAGAMRRYLMKEHLGLLGEKKEEGDR